MDKDIFEKTFYGIAYEAPGGIAYMDNACSAQIYRPKDLLERQGIFVTPVFAETYWYNYTLRLPAVRQKFDQALRQFFTADRLSLLRAISRHNDKLSSKGFQERLTYAADRFGDQAAETLHHYGYRWGIL